MTERKKARIQTAIHGILSCIFLLPVFLLLVAITIVRSLLDYLISSWERGFLCDKKACKQ
ncbi:MAG: hypothetical protein HFI67_02190 [Lachnospiraceae bacterium]|jgi:hypothetical protein|nr:hypothetical protein [Lachnospiraceae bacterium]